MIASDLHPAAFRKPPAELIKRASSTNQLFAKAFPSRHRQCCAACAEGIALLFRFKHCAETTMPISDVAINALPFGKDVYDDLA